MNNITISLPKIPFVENVLTKLEFEKIIVILSSLISLASIIYYTLQNEILSYGDAESHINIAKRVVDSLTPGFAQLGGVWLPLPHLLMVPLVWFDPLWRSGLGGSIISGIAFVVSCLFLYKLTLFITKNKNASFFAFLVFATNPNILYMQSTPMSELVLLVFFLLSTYYFMKYIQSKDSVFYLVIAAFFGFCAALSRYDGWSLVLFEAFLLIVYLISKKASFSKIQGRVIMFSTLAFFAIALWLGWCYLILGNAFYFSTSIYSASSQQHNWLGRGELPAYHNIFVSFLYYFVTSMEITGVLLFLTTVIAIFLFIRNKEKRILFYVLSLLFVPFLFNWATLFLGESVIFIQSLTPISFEWRLFNVRYGLMMMPYVAFILGYLYFKANAKGKAFLVGLTIFQLALFFVGYQKVLTLSDATVGLSASRNPDAQLWLTKHYTKGLVLLDDYARTVSIIKSGIPMQEVINVGTKPYYTDSFITPEKYATWIILQRNDDVWNHLYETQQEQNLLYTYFNKVYTSKEILIFKRIGS